MMSERRRPVRTAQVTLPEPYAGWTATIRTNISMGVYEQLLSGDWDTQFTALAATVLEWNFVDDAGEPVELTPAALRAALGFDQMKLLTAAIDEEIGRFLREMSTSA